MPAGSKAETLPLGPSTRTVLPLTVYLTPVGTGIGFLPIRDISIPFQRLASRKGDQGPSLFHCSLAVAAADLPKPNFEPAITRLRRGSRRQHLRDGPDGRS